MNAIARARQLLTSDPDEALELLQNTARSYPHGYFVEERRALTVFALYASGDIPGARQAALVFLRDYPKGLFTDQVRKAIERNRPKQSNEK